MAAHLKGRDLSPALPTARHLASSPLNHPPRWLTFAKTISAILGNEGETKAYKSENKSASGNEYAHQE